MRRHRDTVGRGWSDRLLRALRAFDGVYEPEVVEEIKKFGGSSVYSRIVAMKCRGTSSLLRDVYLGADRPWGVEPASDPPIPLEIKQAIDDLIHGEIAQAISAHTQGVQAQQAHQFGTLAARRAGAQMGMSPQAVDQAIPSHFSGPSQAPHPLDPDQPSGILPPPPPPPLPDPAAVQDRFRVLIEDARDQAKRKAAEQAEIAEDKLEELLAEGGFYDALMAFLVDLPLFPYACLKGPTVRIKTQVQWARPQPMSGVGGQMGAKTSASAAPIVADVPVMCWERVSPFDVYWTPGVADIADANVIQRSRLTRADINDLLDLPGFITDEVRAVLDEYGRGGLVDNWDTTDAERAILESREDPRFNQSGLIACLEYQGNAQGRYLLDLGVDPSLVPDPLRDYYINAWLIGRHVVKVQLAPSPRKRHNYYVTSFEKVPGTPVGNGLPDLLADIATVANATLRAMVNNLSLSSGPQVVVNDDRMSDDANPEDMYPWKRWHVKSDPFGNNTEKPIEFFSPASNSQELLQVYMAMSGLADEISAIPKFMTGSPPQGGLGRTASGLSLLMQNTAKILQTVAANIDRDVMQGLLQGLFDMVMMTDETGLLTGEEKIRVLGVNVAQQRETQRARQLEFLQLTANPVDMQIIGPHGRAQVLRQVAKEIGIPGEDIVPSDDAMKKQQEAAQQMAQQQGMLGHSMGQPGPPGGGPQGPPGAVAGPPAPPSGGGRPGMAPGPQGATGDVGPRLNLVNRNQQQGAPIRGGVG